MNGNAMTNGYASTSSSDTTLSSTSMENHVNDSQRRSISNRRTSREESKLTGRVKWFNAKTGYGFITRNDNGEDVFVHFSGIKRPNPGHVMRSLCDGEVVEFNIMATNVTGLNGQNVIGNPYVGNSNTSYFEFAPGDGLPQRHRRGFFRFPISMPRFHFRNR